jgi:hypothetical protein
LSRYRQNSDAGRWIDPAEAADVAGQGDAAWPAAAQPIALAIPRVHPARDEPHDAAA